MSKESTDPSIQAEVAEWANLEARYQQARAFCDRGRANEAILLLQAIAGEGHAGAQRDLVLFEKANTPGAVEHINGGTFIMGSPANERYRDDNETQHQVTVSPFCMGKYQVTQEEYQAVMGTNPGEFTGARNPVENVSWYDAVEYCNALSLREGLTPAYTIDAYSQFSCDISWNRDANGYRLPTEAEWEYACRAGTTTAYNTGKKIINDTGWYQNNSGYKPHPIGRKPPNAWGLYDMHGNVWEWCWDWYGAYPPEAQTDPKGPISGSFRVLRGGAWSKSRWHLRSAQRDSHDPFTGYNSIGFRVARSG